MEYSNDNEEFVEDHFVVDGNFQEERNSKSDEMFISTPINQADSQDVYYKENKIEVVKKDSTKTGRLQMDVDDT